jgi:threonine dehydrogenase-like Zn-dependent dehydrogenase
MMKGKLAVMVEPNKLEYQQYQLPSAAKGALLLRIIRANVCGSELHVWNGSHPVKKDGILGHEMVGMIEEIGEGVTKDHAGNPIQIGDRVTATYFQACGRCGPCADGAFLLCENTYEYFNKRPEETPHFHAAFSTHYYVQPTQFFYKVPNNIPDSVAASANCAISQVYYGIDKVQVKINETVVIQGAGGLGLYATAISKESGARVIVIDGVEERLNQAIKFGADHVINLNQFDTIEKRSAYIKELTNGKGADVGIEVAGAPSAFSEGIHHIKPGGRFLTMGNVAPGRTTEFDPGFLTRKSITIYSVNRYQPWYLGKALKFLSSTIHKYPYESIIDGEFDFSEVETALNKSVNREVTRASIVMNEN